MIFSLKNPAFDVAPRNILVLQAEKACWLRIVGKHVVDSYQEDILRDCADQEVRCPWITVNDCSEPLPVELILDTTLDEVDRVGVEESNIGIVNRYRRFMTLARLRRDYPLANIYKLPEACHANVAALMHPAIPAQWASWLVMLQSANLVFHRIVTASELAAHWSRGLDGRVMLVMQVANYERHLLVHDGAVQFLRTVAVSTRAVNSGNDHVSPAPVAIDRGAVAQSMEYLRTVIALDASSINVLMPRFTFLPMVTDKSKTAVSHSVGSSNGDSCVDHQISVLLAMLLGLRIEHDACVDPAEMEQGNNTRLRLRTLWNRHMNRWLLSGVRGHDTDHWSIRHSALQRLDTFEPSVRHVNAGHRVALARRVTVMFALLAALAASSALINGQSNKRLLLQHEIQKASMEREASDIRATANATFEKPYAAASSLFIADALSSSVLLTTEKLLESVATGVTAVPGIKLERLAWTQASRDEPFESLTHSLESVSPRQAIVINPDLITLQLELSGSVSGDSLNEQQALLDNFIAELWHVPGALDARVLESPVDTAMSSQSDANRLGQYRVSLILGKH